MADIRITALPAGTAAQTGIVPVVNSGVTQRITIKDIVDLALANVPKGTVNTVGNSVGLTANAALPIDVAIGEIIGKAAFVNYGAYFSSLIVQSPLWTSGNFNGDGVVAANSGVFGELFYGSLLTPDAQGRATATGGYQMPLPTEQGYLRADQDPASGWYFAEPVVVSDTEPPTPPGDPALPTLWIDPTGTPPSAVFSNTNPPVSVDPPLTETATQPLGVVNGVYMEPDVVGAVPVVVNGKRYLLPLLEAPAVGPAVERAPLFTFADEPVKQQSDGGWIGFDNTGMNYYQPDTVAAVPVLVGGKKYLLPLIAE